MNLCWMLLYTGVTLFWGGISKMEFSNNGPRQKNYLSVCLYIYEKLGYASGLWFLHYHTLTKSRKILVTASEFRIHSKFGKKEYMKPLILNITPTESSAKL